MLLDYEQGLKLKKNPQVTFWRPTGEVASLYDGNDSAHGMGQFIRFDIFLKKKLTEVTLYKF